MEIKLTKDRMIRSDRHQFMLCKQINQTDKETGKNFKKWIPYMFFSDIELLFKVIPQQMLKESNAEGWKECKKVMTRTYNMLAKRLR
jgi:hypothetical protein